MPETLYLTVATSDGPEVERFRIGDDATALDRLFDRISEVAPFYDWDVSEHYLKAVTTA